MIKIASASVPSLELESATHAHCWSDEPVVGGECCVGVAAPALAVEANVVISVVGISQTPVLTVAIGIIDHKVANDVLIVVDVHVPVGVQQSGIGPRTPTQVPSLVVHARSPSNVASGGGGGYIHVGGKGGSGWVVDNEVNLVIRATARNYELVGYARNELKVVGTATNGTVGRSDPHAVASSGVGDAPVVGAGRNCNCNAAVHNDVGSSKSSVGILRNLVLKLGVNIGRYIASTAERTSLWDNGAVSSCIGVEEHLIARAITPHVACCKGYLSKALGHVGLGCYRIELKCKVRLYGCYAYISLYSFGNLYRSLATLLKLSVGGHWHKQCSQ